MAEADWKMAAGAEAQLVDELQARLAQAERALEKADEMADKVEKWFPPKIIDGKPHPTGPHSAVAAYRAERKEAAFSWVQCTVSREDVLTLGGACRSCGLPDYMHTPEAEPVPCPECGEREFNPEEPPCFTCRGTGWVPPDGAIELGPTRSAQEFGWRTGEVCPCGWRCHATDMPEKCPECGRSCDEFHPEYPDEEVTDEGEDARPSG